MKKTASILILLLVLSSFGYFHVKKVYASPTIVSDSWEDGSMSPEWEDAGDSGLGFIITTENVRTGSYATKCGGSGGDCRLNKTLYPFQYDIVYLTVYFYQNGTLPSGPADMRMLGFYMDTSGKGIAIKFNAKSDGTPFLSLYDEWYGTEINSPYTLTFDVWHKIYFIVRSNSSSCVSELYVDDVSNCNITMSLEDVTWNELWLSRFDAGSIWHSYYDDLTLEGGEAGPQYYFNFNFYDLDNEDVQIYVDWALWDSTHDIEYTEGNASLDSGTYYLKTSKYGHLINTTTLDTDTYGNSTIDIDLNMKRHQSCPNGFIVSNDTISSIIVHAETPQLLNFTMSGNVPVQLGVGVPKNASYVQKDGVNMTDWVYVRSPSHIYFDVTSLSNFVFVFPSTTGPVVGPHTDTNFRVKVIVTLNGEWLKECNVTMEGGPENISLWGLTDLFGIYIFWVKNGSYEIVASYEQYRKVKPVNITRNIIIYIDFTIEDIISPEDLLDRLRDFGAWLNLPELDLTCEAILILFLLLILLIIYAIKKASEGPKRKWKYSYLK